MDKRAGAIPSSKLLCGLCFALCFFAFMLTEAFVNERCAVILGSDAVNPIYMFGLACTGVGFLSFPLLRKVCKAERSRKAALLIIGALCLASAAVLLVADRPAPFLVSATAALLLTGHIGGCVYYNTVMYFAGSRYTGRILGAGMGAAILLQFIVQNFAPHAVIFIISIFFSVAFVMYFIIRAPKDWILENPLPYSSDNSNDRRYAVILIVAVVLMSLVSGMIDSVLTAFNAAQTYDVYSGVRLFYALGLIIAGCIADIRKRKYTPIATVCAMLFSSVCIVFLLEENGYFASAALMYLYNGFYIIFLTVMFLDFAPKNSHPELWAGMGRVVRSLTVAATVIPTMRMYDVLGGTALAVGSCILSVGILLVLLPYITNTAAAERQPEAAEQKKEMSPQERLKSYAESSFLTPRETEVLERLLTSEDGVQEIADSLYISRRVLQRYIASIYEKTGTRTRIGLFQSYMDFTGKQD